jgi:hypothetical protein
MIQGRVMRYNEYAGRKYMYVFAPDEDADPELSKMFSREPMSKGRKALVAYACDQCGFTEFYAQSTG